MDHQTERPSYALTAAPPGSAIADKGGLHQLNAFLTIMCDEILDISVLQKHIRNWKDCRAIVQQKCVRTLKTVRIVRRIVGPPDGFSTGPLILYQNNVM